MTSTEEAYMLPRNSTESVRLNAQHAFLYQLAHGQFIHSSIPRSAIHSVADVGTGTGIWLQELAASDTFKCNNTFAGSESGEVEYVGFDISAAQFPSDGEKVGKGIKFVVHDAAKSFPAEYHGKFDLVNVRLLSYAIKAEDLRSVVEGVVEITKPGGYLQWQEMDAIDCWAVPCTPRAKSTVSYTVREREARGLTTAIVTPLITTLQSLSFTAAPGTLNPISWSPSLLRITSLQTVSTAQHPSPLVQAMKKDQIKGAAIVFLQAGIARRRQTTAEENIKREGNGKAGTNEQEERRKMLQEADAMMALVEAWNSSQDPACLEWDCAMTWIVGRKAQPIDEEQDWMVAK